MRDATDIKRCTQVQFKDLNNGEAFVHLGAMVYVKCRGIGAAPMTDGSTLLHPVSDDETVIRIDEWHPIETSDEWATRVAAIFDGGTDGVDRR